MRSVLSLLDSDNCCDVAPPMGIVAGMLDRFLGQSFAPCEGCVTLGSAECSIVLRLHFIGREVAVLLNAPFTSAADEE